MSARVRSLSTLYSPLLSGAARPRRRTWPVIAALVVLVLVGLAAVRLRRAHGSACPSGRCERVGR